MDRASPIATDPLIREMKDSDTRQARSLMKQLGYDLDQAEFARRYRAVARDDRHILLVAERDAQVVALLHAYARPAIDKPPEAVVQALVVDATQRGKGVGAAMMRSAEAWARRRGFTSVALTSRVERSDAHAFYQGLGYRIAATSHLFRREWPTEES